MKTFFCSLLCFTALAIHAAAPPPANDDFANRISLVSSGSISTQGRNTKATTEANEPTITGVTVTHSVWWQWTPPFSGPVMVSTVSSSFDTLLGVFTGDALGALTSIAEDNDSGQAFTSICSFSAVGGVPYVILIGGVNGASGKVILNITVGSGPCTYSISPTSKSFSNVASSSTVSVSTTTGCSWSAVSNDSFLTITSGTSGSGVGTVAYTVDANTALTSRTGTMTIAGANFTVTQSGAPGCTYAITPSSVSIDASTVTNTFTMTAGTGCAWTATPNASWLSIQGSASGTGNGTVTYVVATNTLSNSRSGTITAAGQSITVNQSGSVPCTYSIFPTSAPFTSAGGSSNIVISTLSGCTWTASSGVSWVSFSTTNGTGNATLSYTVASNASTLSRNGTLTVAGLSFTVTQTGVACTFSISPSSASVAAGASTNSLSVTSGAGCNWTAASNDSWLTIAAGTTGTGNGTVSYRVASNPDTVIRNGTLTVAGHTFSVAQAAAPCIYSIAPTSAHFTAVGGSATVTVTAGTGCAWTAISNMGFITVDSGSPGSGNGIVAYTVAANSSATSRVCTMTIAGSTFTITQDGTVACSYGITPSSANVAYSGGGGNISVSANTNCAWSDSSSLSWVTLSPSSGTGNGTVGYTVTANPSSTPRSGTCTVAQNVFSISQAGSPCAFALTPTSVSSTYVGVSGNITVSATAGCSWTSSSDSSWLSITSGSSGTGNGSVGYSVAVNPLSSSRTGRLTIAGITVIFSQSGAPCSCTLSPTTVSLPDTGGGGSITITMSDNSCPWTATKSQSWITVNPASGTGSGSVTFSVSPTISTLTRTGTITIAGTVFSISQSGDTTIPTVTLTNPADGTTQTNIVTLVATAADDNAVNRVEFWIDGSLVGATTSSPFVLPYNTTNLLSTTSAGAITAVSTWTTHHNPPGDSTCRTMCWAPALGLWLGISDEPYIISGVTNVVQTSPDGITWTPHPAPVREWEGVCWSPELHLAVAVSITGTGDRVMTSSDGINWTQRTSAADWSWLGVCWSPQRHLFVAVASFSTTTGVMTSPDGITWTSRTAASDEDWSSVCWSPALGLFVAVASSGTGNGAMTSPDGITWTTRVPAVDLVWQSVCWSPELGIFSAVAASGTGNRVMTSVNGTSWNSRTSAADNQWESVTWSPGLRLFIAVSDTGTLNRVMTSPDGVAWTSRTSANPDEAWATVAWSPKLGQAVSLADVTGGDLLTNRVQASLITTNGTHAFYAKAFDIAGNSGFSATNYATVFNSTVVATNTWAQRFGATGTDVGQAVAVDSSGNIYLAATFTGTISFGPNTFTNGGGRDIVLAKFTSGGTHVWSESFGNTGDEFPVSIALDASNNIYIGGYFNGNGNFGGSTFVSAGGLDFWLARYNSSGVHQWSERIGGLNDEAITSICLDKNQTNVLATGHFQGTVNFGPVTISSADTGIDTFLCKYDASNGNPAWAKSFANRGYDTGIAVMTDSSDNVILGGYFSTRIDLGNGLIFGAGTNGQSDIYLAKYPPAMTAPTTATWQKRWGGINGDLMYAAALDTDGNIITAGTFQTSTDLGGGTITGTSTANDMFTAKYSGSDGSFIWQRGLFCTQGGQPASIAFDSAKQPVVVGSFFGSVNFGGGSVSSAGSQDIFAAKYSSANVPIWQSSYGGSGGDTGFYVAIGSDNFPVVTGSFAGSATFNGTTLTSAGLGDIFLMRIPQ